MSAPRTEVRNAAKAALLGNTVAGNRVEKSRVNPLSQRPSARGGEEELPVISLYTRTTQSEVFDESPRRYRNRVELIAEAVLEVGEDTDIDDDLDTFEEQIVLALLRDETLGGVADDTRLTGSTLVVRGEGAKLLGAVIIAFEVTHYSYAPTEDDAGEMADLVTVHTEHSLSGQQADSADRAITDIEDLEQ